MPDTDSTDWSWELAAAPVTRGRLARILLAATTHERLAPVPD